MTNTRGNLFPAEIYQVNDSGKRLGGGLSVNCMFNPFEYTISKSNRFKEIPQNKKDVPRQEFQQAGAQSLRLSLTFDTYETGEAVTQYTDILWQLMETKTREGSNQSEKLPPPEVAFKWGAFRFIAVIEQMTQKFTLFKKDGTPVRAKVDVSFKQHKDPREYPPTNPTSGGGKVNHIYLVSAVDRLDMIAFKFYGDATKWRWIAEANGIRDPLLLRPGSTLAIPDRK